MTAAPPFDLVIAGGDVVLDDRVERLEIGIRNGKIDAVSHSVSGDSLAVLDASGLIVMPGMIDAHVHFNEPGMAHWEGFASGSDALAAGGCTAYIDMPLNGIPPTVTAAALSWKRRLAASGSRLDYGFWGGLMPGYLHELRPLANAGVVGFKAFMSSPGDDHEDAFRRADDRTLQEGMERIAELGKVLVLHAESERIVSSLTERAGREGRRSAKDYSETRPIEAELEAVETALSFAERAGCRLHFAHISSESAVRKIREARARGLDVSLETCPHYLVLTEDDLARMGAIAKCAPPLRSASERDKLWACLTRGEIDLIASDHSPCPSELKTGEDMLAAWGGISGAQSSLELMVDEGHLQRGVPLPALARLLAGAPAERYGLIGKGAIKEGFDADLALLDLNRSYRLTQDRLYYRHKHTPYLDRMLGCQVMATVLRGRIVYEASEGLASGRAGVECAIASSVLPQS